MSIGTQEANDGRTHKSAKPMKAHIYYNIFTNLYYADLLGGEFDNCYGQGKTPEMAMISLKLAVNARKRQHS